MYINVSQCTFGNDPANHHSRTVKRSVLDIMNAFTPSVLMYLDCIYSYKPALQEDVNIPFLFFTLLYMWQDSCHSSSSYDHQNSVCVHVQFVHTHTYTHS